MRWEKIRRASTCTPIGLAPWKIMGRRWLGAWDDGDEADMMARLGWDG